MKVYRRSFKTEVEAQAYLEGILHVNDSAITAEREGRDVIICDEDASNKDDESED
jgi:hypothetical protein